MRVLLVTQNLAGGGAQVVFLRYAEYLARAGHDVACVIVEKTIALPLPPGVTVTALYPGNARRRVLPRLRAARRLRRWLVGRGSFDLVLSMLPDADDAVRLARLPHTVAVIHTAVARGIVRGGIASGSRKGRKRHSRLLRVYGGRDLIAVSEGVAQEMRALLGPRAGRIETVYNPYDFAALRARATAPVTLPAAPYLIHIGRFTPQKRHDVLLDGYVSSGLALPLVLLVQPEPRLAEMIAARGLEASVIVAGFQENPYPWISGAAALVLSSDYEGLPNVLIEALACGTPVVSTNCPHGPAELLTGAQARFLVACGDASALGRAMAEIVVLPPAIDATMLERFAPERFLEGIARLAKNAVG